MSGVVKSIQMGPISRGPDDEQESEVPEGRKSFAPWPKVAEGTKNHMNINIHTHMHACMHASKQASKHACMHAYANIQIHIHMHIHIHISVYIYIYIHTDVYKYICMYSR